MSTLRLENYVFQQVENSFRLGELLPGDFAWNIDMKREQLSFYSQGTGAVAVECPVQLVGSSAAAEGTWLWAWANYESNLSPTLLEAVRSLKAAGESVGESLYTQGSAFPLPGDGFGMEAAILCAGVSGGFCPYACSYDGGTLYTVIESASRAKELPADPLRMIRAITTGISRFTINHKNAARAYLGEPDASGVYTKAGVKIAFDAQGRIGEISAVLEPPKKPSLPGRLFGR